MLRVGRHRNRRFYNLFSANLSTKSIGKSIRYTPYNMTNEIERIAGVLQDVHLFEYIPVELRTENLYLAATSHSIFDISNFNPDRVNFDLCRFAVQFNARQIDAVPACYKEKLDHWLSQIRTLVVKGLDDDELKQFSACYVRADERKDTTICTDFFYMDLILKKLQQVGVASLNVTFMSHSGQTSQKMAGHDVDAMSSLLAAYPFINSVNLLGCHSVVSLKSEHELALIDDYHQRQHSKINQCGLVLMKCLPDVSQFKNILRQVKLDRTFLLDEEVEAGSGNKILWYIEMNSLGDIQQTSVPLTQSCVRYLESCIRGSKPFAFPKQAQEKFILRDLKNPLQGNELELLMRARDDANVKLSAKPSLSIYPFDADVVMSEREMHKLKPSFMQRLVGEIKDNDAITRDISVTGWTHAVLCDMDNRRAISSTENVYFRKPFTLFEGRIDHKYLAKCRRKQLVVLDSKRYPEMADVQSMQLTVTKRN